MELQEVDVFVEKDRQVKIEVRGVKGMSCLDLTKELEAILGGQIDALVDNYSYSWHSQLRRNCSTASVTPLSSVEFQLRLFARPQQAMPAAVRVATIALARSSRASRCFCTLISSRVLGLN